MTTSLWNSEYITTQIREGDSAEPMHFAFLNLRARETGSADTNFETNRVGLKIESLGIATTRTLPSYPVPGIGSVTGESQTVGLDLGMATKNINIAGIITEQTITKKFAQDVSPKNPTVTMTAYEIAQLIHSYVDSSRFQKHQNMDELILLMPSRVDKKYQYHDGLPERTNPSGGLTSVENLPLIPFTWKVRDQDNTTILDIALTSNFPSPIHEGTDIKGTQGFIRSFSTQIQAGQPYITFTLDFEVAFVI
tara:strand:- start:3826 stop:4578 length:753 start_codon:yes stop_codon:yes gene_type:complete